MLVNEGDSEHNQSLLRQEVCTEMGGSGGFFFFALGQGLYTVGGYHIRKTIYPKGVYIYGQIPILFQPVIGLGSF